MICFRCAADNPSAARFCRQCGDPLGRTCPTCAFENSAESKFCGGCGARLTEAQGEDATGERRQLTVLFCDVVGSTALAQQLDPEDFGLMLAAYQEICGEAVRVHDGYVSQYLGDGVVMYFGYPRSEEDEPQRAIRCALDIIDGVAALRSSRKFPSEARLEVRLGAHTGRVVVGPVGAGDRRDRLALGSAPNIAARLQTMTDPGSVVVSGDTWNIVRGYFRGESLGSQVLVGLEGVVEIWKITGRGHSAERVEVAETLTSFVGRAAELSTLDQIWKESTAGESRFVAVRGEPGIGKSRLTRAFAQRVAAEGANVFVLRATQYNATSSFHPLIELIQARFGLDPKADAEVRRRHLEDGLSGRGLNSTQALALLGSVLMLPAIDDSAIAEWSPLRRRSGTLELLVEVFTGMAAPGPSLLVVEDLHWLDGSTREFLQTLVSASPQIALTGVFTTRAETWLDSARGRVNMLELGGLDRAEVDAMVREVSGGAALPPDLLLRLHRHTDGVPLFVEELTRSIVEAGSADGLQRLGGAGDVLAEELIPATVDASLMARIDRLGASRATAQLAATIGREFSVDLLAEVSDRDQATLDDDLVRLTQSGLVRSRGEGVMQFRHALIRDAAYNSLLRTVRHSFHDRIAEALRTSPMAAARPDLVAIHLSGAGRHLEAVDYWEAAGNRALAQTAVRDAAAHFEAAIENLAYLPASDEHAEREMELQILLAPLLMSVHGWGAVEVERACGKALELAGQLGRHDRSYPPMWGLWTVRFLRSELPAATEAAEAVLGMALASGVPMLEVTGRHAVSFTLMSRGEFRRAIVEADAGLAIFDLEQEHALARAFGMSSTVALHASRADSLWMLGQVVSAEAELERAVALGAELGHPPSHASALAFALYPGIFACSYTGQLDPLLPRVDELAELAEHDDFFLWDALAHTLRAVADHGRGEAGASRRILDGLAMWEHAGARLTLVLMNTLCADAFLRTGEFAEAEARLNAAAVVAAAGEAVMAPEIPRLRGRLLAAQGDTVGAETCFREALAQSRAQEAVPLELRAALDLAELLATSGRASEAIDPLFTALGRWPEGHDRVEPTRAAVVLAELSHQS